LAEFFVRRPIVAMVIAIITVIVGFVAMSALPIAQYPEITPPQVSVTATYTGANAVAVEESVATPIEQKVNGVENMIYMKSTNASSGFMNLQVSFEVGTDLDNANVLTQNRVSEAQALLPEEVKRLGVTVKKQLSFPLLLISVISPNGTYDDQFLTNYATINILDEVARIRGVGQAEVTGGSAFEYAMRIWVKPDQLAKLGLTVPDLTTALREQNVLIPAGQIGGPPAPEGTEFTYTVQTPGRLVTAEEFGEVVVRSNPDGSQVFLRDVARIELGTQNYVVSSRLNAAPSATLMVYQLPDANGLEVAGLVLDTLERLKQRFPEDVDYVIALDTTRPIEAGIREIVITLFQAVALVIFVVYIFLQNVRSTLIPTLAVPVSLIGTFAIFPLLGFSINTLSLLGLVLAIGIVVDDAIVVVEAVAQKMERGMSAKEATIEAMREVSAPIVATSLSLIAVFVPVATMGGITGSLYQQFAITIAISVAISSINALTLSPALAAALLKPPGETKSTFHKFFDAFNRNFETATEKFMVFTGFFTHKLVRAGILLGALIVALTLLFRAVPGGFVPEEDQGYLMAAMQLPDAASLQRTEAVMRQVEQVLGGFEAIESYTTISGYSLLTGTTQPNAGFIFLQLKEWDDRPDIEDHANSLIHRLNIAFATQVTEALVFAFGPPAIPGLGTGSGFTMMLQDRRGSDPAYLDEQLRIFRAAAEERPEIANTGSLFRANVPQIFVDIDKAKALKMGVPLADINTSIGAFLGGAYVNDFNRFGRLYKVYVQAEPEYRADESGIRMFYVRNRDGDMVPLSAPPKFPDNRRQDTARRRRLRRSRKSRIRRCPRTWATPGPTCPTRRKRPRVPAASSS
jgi:HAE1 family hydrophobic/amphiphilic exporter-1